MLRWSVAILLGGCVPSVVMPSGEAERSAPSCPAEAAPDAYVWSSVEVVDVRPERELVGKARIHRTRGARLLVRAPHAAAELEQLARCRAARVSSEGPSDDPLAVPGVEVEVRDARGGLEMRLTSPHRERALELERRAERAKERGRWPPVVSSSGRRRPERL
ncbi:MAG: hypothetical protein RLO52_02045 [Sandaracinaceae bacterium]